MEERDPHDVRTLYEAALIKLRDLASIPPHKLQADRMASACGEYVRRYGEMRQTGQIMRDGKVLPFHKL